MNNLYFLYFGILFIVIIYDCEIPEKIYGSYSVLNENIKIYTLRGEFDNEFALDSKHRHKPHVVNLTKKNDSILLNKFKTEYKREK